MSRVLVSCLILYVALIPAAPAQAASCHFALGFKALHDLIPATVGDCLTDEYYNAANGDGLQQTRGGLLAWRKADNWTAFTDGNKTWINGPFGLESRFNIQRFLWERDYAPDLLNEVPESDQERQVCAGVPPNATGELVADCWLFGQKQRLIGEILQSGSQSPPTQPTPIATPFPLPTPVPPIIIPPIRPPLSSLSRAEWVNVVKVDDLTDHAIIDRSNGETWLIEYGVGCLSISDYEGENVLIYSPGVFAGVGSKVILVDRGQSCQIWDSQEIN